MRQKQDGFNLSELLVIIVVLLLIIFFIAPKFLPKEKMNDAQIMGSDVVSTIYSAYKLCKTEDKKNNYDCDTAQKVIENINYESMDEKNESITLLNQAKIEFSKNDPLKDGTMFAVTLPEKNGLFNIYINGNGIISVNPPANADKMGGKRHKNTTLKLNNI